MRRNPRAEHEEEDFVQPTGRGFDTNYKRRDPSFTDKDWIDNLTGIPPNEPWAKVLYSAPGSPLWKALFILTAATSMFSAYYAWQAYEAVKHIPNLVID